MPGYLLGIDMGGTKTDFLLASLEGKIRGFHNEVTNRKNQNKDFLDSLTELNNQLKKFLGRYNLSAGDIDACYVGLSYAPKLEKDKMLTMFKKILGIEKLDYTGDVTAAYTLAQFGGVGFACHCSTGAAVQGVDEYGNTMHEMEVKDLTGGFSSGTSIRDDAIMLLYSFYRRCGRYSIMFPELVYTLGIDLSSFSSANHSEYYKKIADNSTAIIKIVDNAALAGDELAMELLNKAGISAAQSVAGCINRMHFEKYGTEDKPIDIALFGSIWHKIIYDGMRACFSNTVNELSGKVCRLVMIDEPAVVGALVLAKKMLDKRVSPIFQTSAGVEATVLAAKNEVEEFCKEEPADHELLRFLLVISKNKPEIAENYGVNLKILETLKKYPILSNISLSLAYAMLPAVSAVMRGNYKAALDRFLSTSRYAKIAAPDINAYINLAINISAAAGSEEKYIHFSKAHISLMLQNGYDNEALREAEEFLQFMPEDPFFLAVRDGKSTEELDAIIKTAGTGQDQQSAASAKVVAGEVNLYTSSAHLWDAFNNNNRTGDVDFYFKYAQKYPGSYLELGTGTGRIAIQLAEKGIDNITGLDLSQQMLEVFARKISFRPKLVKKIELVAASMADFKLDRKFSLITAPNWAFTLVTEDEDIKSALSCIREHLTDKGVFIVNMFDPEKVDIDKAIAPRFSRGLDIETGAKFLRKSWYDAADTVNQIRCSHSIIEITHLDGSREHLSDGLKMKYYYRSQLRELIESAGMKVVEEFSGYADDTSDKDADAEDKEGSSIIFVCSKDFKNAN